MSSNYPFEHDIALTELSEFLRKHSKTIKALNLSKKDRAAEIFEAFGYASVVDAFLKNGYSTQAVSSGNTFNFKKTPSSNASGYSYFILERESRKYFLLKDHNVAGIAQGTFNLDVVISNLIVDRKLEKDEFLSVVECKLYKGVSSTMFSSFRGVAYDSVILLRYGRTDYPPPILFTSGKPTKYSRDFIRNITQRYWVAGIFGIEGHIKNNPVKDWLVSYI